MRIVVRDCDMFFEIFHNIRREYIAKCGDHRENRYLYSKNEYMKFMFDKIKIISLNDMARELGIRVRMIETTQHTLVFFDMMDYMKYA